MPHEVIRAPGHDRRRSLGWLATRWIEEFCVHGPGDIQGRPLNQKYEDAIPLSDELVAYTVDAYALDDRGRRLYDSAFYSRPKGANKSGYDAFLGQFEALGPCRFGGWAKGGEVFEWMDFRYVYEPGEPMGRRITYPFLRIMATEESQTDNVYDALLFSLKNGPLRMAFSREDDLGITRVYLPDGGEIRPSTASSAAKDGGKESWCAFDETHLYWKPELRRMYDTVRRNMAKRKDAEPWSQESSTMYEPGRDSVAERTHRLAQDIRDGRIRHPRLLFDHREASADTDLDDDVSLLAGLREAYGDAVAYMDLERLTTEIRDPRNDPTDSVRFFLNRAAASGARAFDLVKWRENARPGTVIPAGDAITLGFDGSRTEDSTSLRATHLATGFQWTVGIWERPAVGGDDWEVPEPEVDEAVDRAFRTWRVVRMYADTSKWETAVSRWAGRYNHEEDANKAIVVKWPVSLHKKTAIACKAYAGAILAGDVTHDGNVTSTQHIANSYRRMQNFTDDDGSPLYLVTKERPMSPNKIDDAYAGILSWQARLDAIALGLTPQPDYGWVVG